MAVVTARDTWAVAQSRGRLVKVEIKPGVFIQLYEEQARAQGLLPPVEVKPAPPARNKARRKPATKAG